MLLIIVLSFLTPDSYSQKIEDSLVSFEKIPAEKIYIHTHAENYFTGDTLWFKVYLIDSRSGQLIPRAENIYVKIADESGNTVKQALLLSVKGQVSGRFVIDDKLRSGNYLLQAHTNYLLNFGPEAFFYKHFTISTISGTSRMLVQGNRKGNMVSDVQFLPEGGVLLQNSTNLVAFKAVDKFGFGVDTDGKVVDENGTVVTSFSTDYKGMGLLFLMPEEGKKYYATINGFPKFRYEFKAVEKGVKIQLVNHTLAEVILNISGNSQSLTGELFYLLNMYRGEVLFYKAFEMDGLNKVLKLESSLLKPGINKLILLDKNLTPVSERLLFSENFETNNIKLFTDKEVYKKKSLVSLKLNCEKNIDSLDIANLSMIVVHDLAEPENGFSKNILSQMLIDSEIKGFVESSADFLKDNEISSEAKLRLLMLSTSPESYFWNTAPPVTEEINFVQESGIKIRGIARNTLTNNIIKNGEITLAIQKDNELAFITQTTDSAGRFEFTGLLFSDTAKIHVQAKTETGKMNIEVLVDSVFQEVKPSEAQTNLLGDKLTIQSELAALKYQIYTEKRKNSPRTRASKRIKDKQNIESDGHIRMYESADFVLDVDPNEQSYGNVLDYMVGKIPGVDVGSDYVRIRGTRSYGGNTVPLFLIDGVPLVGNQNLILPDVNSQNFQEADVNNNIDQQIIQSVQAIPLTDVDKIEVLKSSQNTSLYGVKGANGIIAIYTRHGTKIPTDSKSKGIIEKNIAGYMSYKNFYSPEYSEMTENKLIDLRTLLYWNPELETSKGEIEIQFYTSEQSGKYKIFIEGITNNGIICLGSGSLEVR